MKRLFERVSDEPIIRPEHVSPTYARALNPGAAPVGSETVLLLRLERRPGLSDLYVARSQDGVSR